MLCAGGIVEDAGGMDVVAFSADAKDGVVANLAVTPVVSALRVLCGVANGWTVPVRRIVVIVKETDLCRCFIMIVCMICCQICN